MRDDDAVLLGVAHAGVELVQHARLDGQSWALTTALVALTLSSACTTLAQLARSCLREERTSPVTGSR